MPLTTLVRDSEIGDAWIKQACEMNPVQFVQGQPGNILTGPVRLAFVDNLFEAGLKMKTDPNSKTGYQCAILFPPTADLTIFFQEYERVAKADFAQHWNGQTWAGLEPCIRNQGEKAHQFSGYTPNCGFFNASSNYKPAVVDTRMNPIVDRNQVYAGCWAIVVVNCYAAGKNKPKKGPRFGLQTVMKFADDKNLGGAAPDPRTMYGSVKVIAPSGPVAGAFGQQPPPAQQFGQSAVQQFYNPPARDDDVSGFM